MKKILNSTAPKSRKDLFHKVLVFFGLVIAWDWLATRVVLGIDDRLWSEQLLDTAVSGWPFVILFYLGSWQQMKVLHLLSERSTIDPLSGLKNRQTFLKHLRDGVSKSKTGLLLLIDADHFKRVNDDLGHAAGDKCIEAIGHRLNWNLREGDLAGRLGGEEFAVFLPNVNLTQGRSVTTRLGQPVTFVDDVTGQHHSITLSIGAVRTVKGGDADAQLLLADDALYRAKSEGRARVVFAHNSESILLSSPLQEAGRSPRTDYRRAS